MYSYLLFSVQFFNQCLVLFQVQVFYILYCCCCSVVQSCPTLCNPINCSTPGLFVPNYLLEFAQVHVHCIGEIIQPSHPLIPSSPSALSQASGTFPMSQLFISGGQNTGASASAAVLPMSM